MRFFGPGTLAATAGVTLLSGISGALAVPESALPVGASVACVLGLGAIAMPWAERRAPRAIPWLIAAQVPLALLVIAASGGGAFLVAMPLLSTAVLFLRLRTALLLAAVLTAGFAAVALDLHGMSLMGQACFGFASASGFVIVFSRLMRRERVARAQVERLVRDLRVANERLAESVTQAEELATTRERNRIAREVHDSVGHTLTVAGMQLEAARTQIEGPAAERVERVQQILRDGLGELRRSVSMLRVTPSTPQAFTKAISELVEDCRAAGLDATLETEGAPRPLSGSTGFALFRAAQEALTNARRHARAEHARVRLEYREDAVVLRVSDDGAGAEAITPGNGLTGLRERIALLGGEVEIETSPGRGLELRVEVPA